MTYVRESILKELKYYRLIMRTAFTKRVLDKYYQEVKGFIWGLYYVDAIDHSSWKRYSQYFFDLWEEYHDKFDYMGEKI